MDVYQNLADEVYAARFPEKTEAELIWDQEVERINALPEIERKQKIERLCLTWDFDYDILKSLWNTVGQTFKSRGEYEEECRGKLIKAFGYSVWPFELKLGS